MTTPTYTFKLNGVSEADKLQTFFEQKLLALQKYWGTKPVYCAVEFEKVAPRHTGQVHRVEANLTVDGTLYRAEAAEESFEKAIDEVRNELDKMLRRSKKKGETLFRRGAQILKRALRRG